MILITAMVAPFKNQALPVVPQETTLEHVIHLIKQLKDEDFEKFFSSILPELIKSINLGSIPHLIHPYQSVREHAAMAVPHQNAAGNVPAHKDQLGFLELTWRLILNVTDTFITALNFYDESDPPSSVYEKQVLITIYYRLIQIPIGLCLLLQPLLIVAWKVYVVAMVILAATVAALYIYNTYFRPYPAALPCCEMNSDLVNKLYPDPIIGLENETNALISLLNQNDSKSKPIMILGATGSGKTTLMHKLQQQINNNKVPPSLRNKKIVTILGGQLMAKSSSGFGDKLKRIKSGLAGFEKDTIIHIDEIQAIAKNAACFELIKEFIRTPGLQCVTSTTLEAFNTELIPADLDHSFRRSFGANYISMDTWKFLDVESLLQQIALNTPDVYFGDNIFKKIVELTDGSLHELPQPAKAIELMQQIIKKYRSIYDMPESKEQREMKARLVNLEQTWKLKWPNEDVTDRELRLSLATQLAGLEKSRQEKLKSVQYFRSLLLLMDKLKAQTMEDAKTLQNQPNPIIEKRYLFTYFYLLPALKNTIEEQSETLNLKVDNAFVLDLFVEYRKKKENVHRKSANIFKGLIKNPSVEAVDEVKSTLKMLAGVPHGMGNPTFQALIIKRWEEQQNKLKSMGFANFELYEAVICEACNDGGV